MRKIATHNSATGEPGKGLLSWLITPFARCQSKTIREQLEAGATYFDIRVRYDKNGMVRCAHGLWESESTLYDVVQEIGMYADCNHVDIRVEITYEGQMAEIDEGVFLERISHYFKYEKHMVLAAVNVKKPEWRCIKAVRQQYVEQAYKKLDGSSWHTYLPLPYLWKKLYHNRPQFNEETYKMVDFV